MFKCLPSLETLRLNLNRFNTLCNNLFRGVPNLQVLFIQRNVDLKIIEKFAFNSSSLKKVYLDTIVFASTKVEGKAALIPTISLSICQDYKIWI